LAGLLGLFLAGGAQPADAAKPLDPAVYLQSAGLTPDSQAVVVRLDVYCSQPQTVVDARVSVAQPQASGQATFSPRCIQRDIVEVTVPSSAGVFETGEAQVNALVVFGHGGTKEARDAELMRVGPIVTVALADQGRLENGGATTVVDVTVACPVGSTGQQSPVFRYPSQAFYLPTCDGRPHTFAVRLDRTDGQWLPGPATVDAFAHVEQGGDRFTGWDRRVVQVTAG
jgi:lipoprotein-anchoring transpeptidase ErfK/SrfK